MHHKLHILVGTLIRCHRVQTSCESAIHNSSHFLFLLSFFLSRTWTLERLYVYLTTDSILIYICVYIIFDTVAEPQDVKSTRRVTTRQKPQFLDVLSISVIPAIPVVF